MKTFSSRCIRILSRTLLVLAFAGLWIAGPARAGLTVDVHLYHDQYGYYFYPYLSTNTTAPAFPIGDYEIASWEIPTNGSRLLYHADTGVFYGTTGGGNYYHDFDAFLYGITNQPWSIWVTNATATNHFKFSIAVTGLTSNVFGAFATVTFPTNTQQAVSDVSEFTWTGPTDWVTPVEVWDYLIDTNGNWNYVDSEELASGVTNWTPSVLLPDGTNTFTAYYNSNLTATVVAATPTNTIGGQAISGWTSTAQMETSEQIQFNVGQPANSFDVNLVARYDFELTNSPGTDSSGNGNNPNCGEVYGSAIDGPSTDAAVGIYARQYFGDTSFCFAPGNAAYQNLSNALSGNFTLTAWVKTTDSVNSDFANAYFGLPILFVYSDGVNQAVFSITGSKAAFTVGNPDGGSDTTLHSTTTVNDGNYHFLAATRDQASGLMNLYVDGNLEATDISTNGPRSMTSTISVAGGYYVRYSGLLDDVRIYSTNLADGDVASLASSGNIPTLASAIGATNLIVTTSGDANWFIETTNTYNGSPSAAQSGVISDYQVSTLSATVTGPGMLTFYWSSVDNDPNQDMDYEFSIDDPYTNDIADLYGANDWQSIVDYTGGPIPIPPGQHTLQWTVFANGDADPFQAGFLDQVVFTPPDTSPVLANITLNIYRQQDPNSGEYYILFPSINSITPAGTGGTTNVLQSPNNAFSAQADQGGGYQSSYILGSLGAVLNECTNNLWNLYINYGQPNQRQFQFSVVINGLTTNELPAVQIIVPANGATGIPSSAVIQWLGPTNYSTLNVSRYNTTNFSDYLSASLPASATSWSPGLDAGTNRLDVNYASNNFPNVSFSVPVDTNYSQTVAGWTANMNLNSTAGSVFVVTAGAAHVALLNPHINGANFQFSFQSQGGFTNTIQYRTNLVSGAWQTYTNVPGDGSLISIPVPLSLFNSSRQGFIRVSTQ